MINARLGNCAADFTVTDASGAPVYAATVHVRIRYGFMSVKRMDLEVGTGSDGKARVEGLPEKAKPLIYDVTKNNLQGRGRTGSIDRLQRNVSCDAEMREEHAMEHLVAVSTVQGQFAEEQVRAFLEANGIPTQVRGETLRTTYGISVDGLGRVEILVPATAPTKPVICSSRRTQEHSASWPIRIRRISRSRDHRSHGDAEDERR